MVKHIGIAACSAEGAALCYRTICLEGEALMGSRDMHPEITMHTHPLGEYMKYVDTGDWSGVAGLMLDSARKLAKAGADFVICPDNTIHEAFDIVIEKSPLPWLHIAEEVAKEARRRKFRKLGILGTKYLMEGPVYPEKLEKAKIGYIVPDADTRRKINAIIFNELVKGVFKDKSRKYFTGVIRELKKQGCGAVVLGCTEIPLLVAQQSSPLPILDSTRLLARAALREAIRVKES
ncbi:aspartate racemase [Candidatus Desantisbacteria bacterium CG_4_10_14_0_8_um_filter_48_22]|uniref:Aspartate racemase n=1 Tax=Candidatus Desantisbacteria bacterium CG_4_10_14_0_8_um_filter_48_22 TaxID=1974543 RepID=A0A2M7S4H3_9BACT|nr:MAG: aspartate racemase [Candidatus Desantisbacteria bacterium CG02_land_8_20_14_3_00_49_13]PIZ14466.1 MAG: aspartate racemase [Candidatus Desantisbacteria bacterium CG_4_10_14_0_8_um_filter_48_22]